MRTEDPEAWSKSIRKAPLSLARPMRFGKKPQVIEPRPSGSSDALKEYKRNCSVSGVRYITDETNSALIRYSYAVLLFLLLCAGVCTMSMNASQRVLSEPSSVAQREGLHSAQDVPFPAVGLCANHVVSTRALNKYTATLVHKKQYRNKTYSREAIARSLAHLGHLLTMTMPQELDANFMSFLASLDPKATVASLMYNFAPNCSSMLMRCSWRGQTLPCQDLFQTRVTPLGYCCVFNSRYDPKDNYKLPQFLDVIGEDYGLSVVVQQDFDDVSFFRRHSHDIDVLIFDGNDYPLLEGGGARLYPAEGNASVYLSLSVSAHYPEEGYDFDTLRCRPRRWTGAGAARSHAGCLAACRARALEALCACRLHTRPPRTPRRRDLPECEHRHLDCLNKHREKLMQYYPGGPVQVSWETEPGPHSALDCAHCEPDCARVVYAASVAVLRHGLHALFKDRLLKDIPAENETTIRLFYSPGNIKSYVFQSNSAWYEVFVHLGSEWALIVGASVVSVSELVFHCSLRWRRPRREPKGVTIESIKV